MFGEPVVWDRQRRYQPGNLDVYFEHLDEKGNNILIKGMGDVRHGKTSHLSVFRGGGGGGGDWGGERGGEKGNKRKNHTKKADGR